MGISQRCSVVVVVCCLTAHSLSAQPIAITQLLDRMGDYLTTYEPQLSSVVAEEHFEQNVYPTRRGATSEHVTLESEVAFTRLPGAGGWIDTSNGKVWRVEWHYQREGSPGRPPYVRVDFAPNEELQLMVPVTMTEGFYAARGRGEGRATYRNFRRFGTSARIVPQ